MSDYFDRVDEGLRAIVRSRRHLPWYRRIRLSRGRTIVAAAATAVVLTGSALAAAGVFTSGTTVSAASCTVALNQTRTRPCLFVLSDGRRFQCPEAFARAPQTPESLAHSDACVALPPLSAPAAWRGALSMITRTQTCLAHNRRQSSGGPILAPNTSPPGLVGELVSADRGGSALIAFYENSGVARRLEPAVARNAARAGGSAERRGNVTVVWLRSTSQDYRTVVSRCAFG
jgi:hypothetical protein